MAKGHAERIDPGHAIDADDPYIVGGDGRQRRRHVHSGYGEK
ncbi:MAG: hypothetical protein U0559_01810 [Anaerolineae bacterium]